MRSHPYDGEYDGNFRHTGIGTLVAVLNRLTSRKLAVELAAKAEAAKASGKPKIISDGGGLYVRVRADGSASFFFAATVKGQRREMGLGSVAAVDLDLARDKASEARKAIASGRDPFAEKATAKLAAKELAKVPTFGEFADDYVASIEAGFRNSKHRAQWKSTLRTYAAPLWKVRIDEVTTDHVLKALKPIWTAKPETASRVRGRIERVLDAAKARGLRPRDSINPAQFKGHLQILLPKRRVLSRGHHVALPIAEAPEFMAKLRARPALAARALEFAILTAARTGEVLGARWGEIEWAASTWVVPAIRMKAGVEHRVPLSAAALALLKALAPEEPDADALIFADRGKPLGNMAMLALLKRMKIEVTTHGFRSTFRDFCGDKAGFPRELAEAALAHTLQSKSERAYRRGTAVELRRPMMAAWAAYLGEAAERLAA